MSDTTSTKVKYKLSKNCVVYDEKVPRQFRKIVIVTGVSPSRHSETQRNDSEN